MNPQLSTTPTPTQTHHHIVFLQAAFCDIPKFNLPAPHTYTKTVYQKTSLANLHDRICNASILVFSALKVDAASLSPETTPYLRCIVLVATGTDCVDLQACSARGIAVVNCPNANVESVSEHAIGLYFATRRKMPIMHSLTMAGEWPKQGTLMFEMLDNKGQPPRTCQGEVVGIVGYGCVGKRIAALSRALGMAVLISGRKDSSETNSSSIEERVPFEQVIETCTVVFIAVPLNNSTRHIISMPEFKRMPKHSILVNISRGNVVDEEALVTALKENRIAGAATDVFREEPAGPENSPLLREDAKGLNLVATPHLAWLAVTTRANQSRLLKHNVEQWVIGRPVNAVV